MEDFIVDASQRAKFNFDNIVKVRDESGKLIGRFLPDALFREMFEAWADSQVTKEELDAARKAYREEGGLTTAEAIAYIKRLAGEEPK
jgi:hypothetical protein